MIFQIDTTIDSSSFISNLTTSDWFKIIGILIALIGLYYTISTRLKAKKEKKKNREKYFKHGGWIKATALKYLDLDKKRDKQVELNPTNHEALYKDILAFINSNPKTKNILLVGQSLSGKSHLTTRFINQLKNAYVLLPTHELLEKTDEIEKLFPKPPKKAKIKILLVDDLQEYLAKGKHISETILHFINTENCIVWFNYVKHGNSNDFGFKQLDSFKTFEIQKLGGDEIRNLKKHQTKNIEYDSDGTIGSLFYPLEWMEKKYGELKLLPKNVISIIKQAYMLGFHDESFVMPYDIIYNYFKAEYEAPNNTKTNLDEALDELAKFSFIANTITHKNFVFEPVYLDKVVNPTLKYDDFVDSWEEKGLMNAKNWFSVGYYFSVTEPDLKKAINAYQKTVDIKPDYHQAWYNMGKAYGDLGKHKKAIEKYLKAVEIKPDYHDAWYNMGIAYYNLGSYEIAIENYKKAVDIKPDKQDAWFNIGVAYDSLEIYETAIENYKKALDIKPDDYETWNNMGSAYAGLGNYETAIENYQKAVDIKSDYYQAWYNMGVAYYSLGKYEFAIEKSQKAVDIKPDMHEAWFNMGVAYDSLGKFETAIENYQKAVEIKLDYYEAWYNMGLAYEELGDEIKAKEFFDKYDEILKEREKNK